MKKEIKINFLYYEDPFDFENNFFIKILKKKYKVVISDKPDYVFFSVYKHHDKFLSSKKTYGVESKSFLKKMLFPILNKRIIKDFIWFLTSKKIIGKSEIPEVKGNFVKIFYTYENVVPDMNKCDWAFSFCYEDEFKHPKHFRLPYYFVALDGKSLIKNKIEFNKLKKEKTKFCNFIYKAHFPLRNKFFRKLSKYKKVDAPGKCMSNISPIGNHKTPFSSRLSGNFLKEKQKFLKNYKFTIAFENSSLLGYTTEKIVQPMLENSIPIYWGNPEIGRDFNTKSFINCHEFKNFNEVIKKIKEIDSDDKIYEKMLEEPWLKGNKPNEWMDEKRIEKTFKEIFG